jgi:hypothetical protein
MSEGLNVSAGFEGANPPPGGILKLGENKFKLKAFSETGAESFRMETMITNDSCLHQTISLEIIWPTEFFSELRDCFYWKHETAPDWTAVPAEAAVGKSFIEFAVPPGKGFMCLHPGYSYEDSERFSRRLADSPLADNSVFASSENGRNIRLIKFSSLSLKKDRPRFLISARNHANESAGSYCLQGMVEWLLSKNSAAAYFLKKIDFYFIPMTNPDGVADGMARFTGPRLADLNRTAEWLKENSPGALPDKSHEAFFNIIDSLKPTHFLNMHSYLFKHKDEIHAFSEGDIDCFTKFFPDDTEAGKIWKRKILTDESPCPAGYSRKKFGTLSLLLEIPWVGRDAETMKKTGAQILRALILMNTVGDGSWGDF